MILLVCGHDGVMCGSRFSSKGHEFISRATGDDTVHCGGLGGLFCAGGWGKTATAGRGQGTAVDIEGQVFLQSPILLQRLSAAVNGAGAVSVAGGNPSWYNHEGSGSSPGRGISPASHLDGHDPTK